MKPLKPWAESLIATLGGFLIILLATRNTLSTLDSWLLFMGVLVTAGGATIGERIRGERKAADAREKPQS
jgi:hypothetical protein